MKVNLKALRATLRLTFHFNPKDDQRRQLNVTILVAKFTTAKGNNSVTIAW